MVRRGLAIALIGCTLAGAIFVGRTAAADSSTIYLINVSYDPTREFYEAFNQRFTKHWQQETGQKVEVIQSHGGSAKQALEVANGLGADVVTLALEVDVNAIAAEGLIEENWKTELPKESAPYTSTIVFLVKKGNPKNIRDWNDLIREDVGVVTPNPKTSGGARWNYLAAWGYANEISHGNQAENEAFMKKLYQNVVVLDSGARGATSSFIENGQGDVLIAWENEAYLTLRDYGEDYELITPSISVLAQPSVSVVDSVAKKHGTEALASAYLEYLYTDEAQRLAAEHYYRPVNAEILAEYQDRFDQRARLLSIDDFGGWEAVMKTHFADGGVFDQIYE